MTRSYARSLAVLTLATPFALSFLAPATAACLDEVQTLSAQLDSMADEGRKTADTTPESPGVQTAGLALTGDPVNPFPPEPTTAEAPKATPTGEEATAVMPGADPSVSLVSEEGRAEIVVLLDEARAAASMDDEDACMTSLEAAREMVPTQ